MPPKSKDPFNFDDLYKAVGADAFVHKSMGELKAKKPAAPAPPTAGVSRSSATTYSPTVPSAAAGAHEALPYYAAQRLE